MRRTVMIIVMVVITLQILVAGQHSSVPLGHRVYDILDSAELRKIIPRESTVRPYTTSLILDRLEQLLDSDRLTQSERREVQMQISLLTPDFAPPENFHDMLRAGSYRSNWEEVGMKAAAGVTGDVELTHSLVERGVYDSRNAARAYISADILDFASVYMDIGFRMDHLDPSPFLPNDYSIPSEGKYDTIFDHSSQHTFYYGLDLRPEVSLSFLDNNLQLRWASIARDWGVGMNNLMISGSARSFEGIELAIKFTPWLNYNFITGSLGKFAPDKISDSSTALSDYFNEYQFSDGLRQTLYDNNYSAHRVEVSLPYNFTFGIYESIIYGRRFELAYLNPFNIIMFQQNILGDFDNMLAGIDLEWVLPGVLRAYGALATTEMNEISPSKFFSSPRNIMGMQGGLDFHIPVGNFSKLTFQYTYLNAFFYTHYPIVDITYSEETEEYNRERTSELMFVNKGENLGYPLRPNSDEVLVRYTMGFSNGISTDITAKYQRRSGQYGFNMDEFMVYKAFDAGLYPEKDFAGNLFEKSFGLDLGISKTFSNLPLTIYGKYLYTATNRRTPQPVMVWDYTESERGELGSDPPDSYDLDSDNYHAILYSVENEPWSGWNHSHAIQIGISIWH